MFQQVLRAALLVRNRCCQKIDPQIVIKGRQHLLRMNGTIHGNGGRSVRRSDHLPRAHATARQNREVRVRPMVTAGVLVDFWRAPKLSPADHRNVFVQATIVDVFDQRR